MKTFIVLALSLLWATSASAAGCLKYGDVVSLYFKTNTKFMAAELDGNATVTRAEDQQWEKFLVLDDQGNATGADVASGARIALRSAHDRHLVAEPSGDVNANRAHIAAWEIWTIHPFNYAGGTPTGCIFLGSVSDQGFVSLRSHHGKFLRGVPNGDARADLSAVDTAPMPGNSTFIAMYRHPWTDFYYKRGIPSMDGACNRCPDGGRWDGANCFIAEQGAQTGFTYEGNVYVQGGPTCVYGDYDGANCKLSSLTQGQKPFVYNGSLYARDACAPQDTASSGDNCRATMFGNAENAISGTAKMQAKNAWRRAVNTTHGPDFKRWTKAQFRRVDCVQTGTVLNWNYECTAIGNPCHKDQ